MPRNTDDTIEYIEGRLREWGFGPTLGKELANSCFSEMLADGEISNDVIEDWIMDLMESSVPGADSDLGEFDFGEFDNAGSMKIGGAYKGIRFIKEDDNDKFYCPSSNYCVFKCMEKYYSLLGKREEDGSPISFSRIGVNAYYNSKSKYLNIMAEHMLGYTAGMTKQEIDMKINEIKQSFPPFVHVIKSKKDNGMVELVRVNHNHKPEKNSEYRIGLLNVDNGVFHALLLKTTKNLKVSDFKLKLGVNMELNSDWVRMKTTSPKERANLVIIYDIETSIYNMKKVVKKVERDVSKFVPHALAYQVVEFHVNPETRALEHTFHGIREVFNSPGLHESESDLFDNMFEDFNTNYKELFEGYHTRKNQHPTIQLFAHNGAKFDNVFSKICKKIRFTDQIKNNGIYKSITCTHEATGDLMFQFKDTLPFCLASLKSIATTLKCTPKDNFDISNWTRAKYEMFHNSEDPKTNWRKYMRQDVETLSEIFIKLEEMYNKLGCSLTTTLGLPGVAFQLLQKTCFAFSEIYRPKDPSMVELIKNSTYGGRVLCLKRKFDTQAMLDVLICLDANSLYPSAMAIGAYPVGKAIKINTAAENADIENKVATGIKSKMTLDGMRDSLKKGAHLDGRSKLVPHYILTIKYKVPNIKQTIVPHKEDGRMIYPTNGIYEGSYNDVDIREMLLDNYEIVEVINGIYWSRSERLFTNLIEYMYNERSRLKAEGNFMEYVFKITINAMYGKMLEIIKSVSYFKQFAGEDFKLGFNETGYELPNGQIEIAQRLKNFMVTKPLQLGSYILSYSRAIMNQYIRAVGLENIWYGDTDSIYVTKSAFEKSGIKESTILGGVKNDYGDAVYITDGIFLDLKRYFLQKVDNRTLKAMGCTKELQETDPVDYQRRIDERQALIDKTVPILIQMVKDGCPTAEVRKIADTLKDPFPISCKYVGLTFKSIFEDVYTGLAGDVIWTSEQKKSIKNLYVEIRDNYNDYVLEGSADYKETIKRVIRVMEKWRRFYNGVQISKDEVKFAINPAKKNILVKHDLFDYEAYSLGYDFNQPGLSLSKGGNNLKDFCSKAPISPGIVYMNKKKGITIKSVLPLTHSKIKGFLANMNAKKSECDLNDRFKCNYYLHVAPNGIKSPIYCFRESKKISPDEVEELGLKVMTDDELANLKIQRGIRNPNMFFEIVESFFNTCILGPTVEIDLTDEEKANLIPLFATAEEGYLLRNTLSDYKMRKLFPLLKNIHTNVTLETPPEDEYDEEIYDPSDEPLPDDDLPLIVFKKKEPKKLLPTPPSKPTPTTEIFTIPTIPATPCSIPTPSSPQKLLVRLPKPTILPNKSAYEIFKKFIENVPEDDLVAAVNEKIKLKANCDQAVAHIKYDVSKFDGRTIGIKEIKRNPTLYKLFL